MKRTGRDPIFYSALIISDQFAFHDRPMINDDLISQNDVMMGDRVVDINVATVEELETLVGVGRAKAEAIVTTRAVSI